MRLEIGLSRLWHRLTDPKPSVQDPVARLQARWLASLLIIAVPLGVLVAAAPGLFRQGHTAFRDTDFQIALGSLILWGVIYALSRTRRYRLAGVLTVTFGSVVIFATAIVDFQVHKINYVLMPILFGSVMLPYRVMLVYIGGNLAGILFLAQLHPDLALTGSLLEPLSFIGMGAGLAMFLTYQRTRLSEYRRAELAESEARYRSLFEDSPIAIWVEDFSAVKAYLDDLRAAGVDDLRAYLETHPEAVGHCASLVEVVDVNQAALQFAEVACKDDLLRGLERLITEEAVPGFAEELVGIWDGNARVEVELTSRTASGRARHLTATWQVAPGYERTLSRCLVSTQDITDRKTAERALRESERRYRVLFESTGTATCVFGDDSVIRLCNENFMSLVAMPQEAIIGSKRWSDFVAQEDLARMRRYHAQRTRGTGTPPREYEFKLVNAHGELHDIYLQLGHVAETGERIASLVDVTRLKRAEEKIRRNEERLRLIIEGTEAMLVNVNVRGRITYVNDATARRMACDPDEMVGQFYLRFIHPEDRARVNATYREQAVRGTVSTMQEFRLVTRGDEECWVHFVAHPIMRDREVVEMAGLALDITERKEMERQLLRQERLAAVGQLAAGIAHDFRNLLSTIILYAEMDLRRSDLPHDLARHLRVISRESHTASDLVQQILDFSSNAMLNPRPLDLEAHTENVLSTLRRTVPESISISLETEADDYTVVADPARIQQAVTNLVLNARDAMPNGGEMRFALTRLHVGADDRSLLPDVAPGAWVCLSVSDTGVGMTEEVQAHLFEPFYTTKETGEGTGLGLAQVFGIVRQHAGHIDVETAPDQGATFRIYLPVQETEVEPAPADEPPVVATGRGETVLLVEDEVGVRDAVKQVLESLAYQVITAKHGRDALAILRSQSRSVEIVVTDLVMPEMGGKQLLEALHRIAPELPVLAITGYALAGEDLNALLDEGFADVVFKPLDVEGLVQRIRQVLDA